MKMLGVEGVVATRRGVRKVNIFGVADIIMLHAFLIYLSYVERR